MKQLSLEEMIAKTQEIADSNIVAAENANKYGDVNYELNCISTMNFYERINEFLVELKEYRNGKTK